MLIGEVAKKFGLSADTLRFYEKEGLIQPIKKSESGIRDYDEHDLRRIEFIKCMRDAEIPVETLRQYITLFETGDDTTEQRKKLLEKQRVVLQDRLANLQKAYERLTDKINLYYAGKLDDYYEKVNKEMNE